MSNVETAIAVAAHLAGAGVAGVTEIFLGQNNASVVLAAVGVALLVLLIRLAARSEASGSAPRGTQVASPDGSPSPPKNKSIWAPLRGRWYLLVTVLPLLLAPQFRLVPSLASVSFQDPGKYAKMTDGYHAVDPNVGVRLSYYFPPPGKAAVVIVQDLQENEYYPQAVGPLRYGGKTYGSVGIGDVDTPEGYKYRIYAATADQATAEALAKPDAASFENPPPGVELHGYLLVEKSNNYKNPTPHSVASLLPPNPLPPPGPRVSVAIEKIGGYSTTQGQVAVIPDTVDVEGSVGKLAEGQQIWVVLRPTGTTDYWAQRRPAQVHNGHWVVRDCHFGKPGRHYGATYDVWAVVGSWPLPGGRLQSPSWEAGWLSLQVQAQRAPAPVAATSPKASP